jgi:signal transduction histidine kinase
LLNFETRNAIATLQEQFNAAEREKENQKLMAGIEKAQIQNRFSIGVAIGVSLLGFMILYAWQQKRKANAELTQLNQTIMVQNQKLATLNQEKNKLMSMVSHDLSTPFASVRMWAEVLGKQKETLPEQQQAIEKILASAQRGENLIQQILQVEKMGTLQQALALEEIQLSRFIAHLLTDFESKAKAKNIELLYEAPSQEVELLTDQQIIARILQNLVSNALKFTEPGKKVWVRLLDTTEHVLIDVEDQGQGIPAQEMNLLFTPYGQLSSRPTQGESSTGLGLSIVKRLVDELQGTISCQSRPQQGTRFTVRLPR